MRTLIASLCLLAAAPALAAPATQSTIQPATAQADASLDDLFVRLKKERTASAAERIADDIQARWLDSGSATIDLMVGWSEQALHDKKFDVALDFLDQVTVLAPAYAEGWNRRAIAHFLQGDQAKAMTDIEKVLQLEPRHFGALAGLANILRARGHDEMALRAYEQVLALYPGNREAQDAVTDLTEQLTGDRI
jgi:tetratricopeptide (TPR) repeat protein